MLSPGVQRWPAPAIRSALASSGVSASTHHSSIRVTTILAWNSRGRVFVALLAGMTVPFESLLGRIVVYPGAEQRRNGGSSLYRAPIASIGLRSDSCIEHDLSELPSPAEVGFANAENRAPLFGITLHGTGVT